MALFGDSDFTGRLSAVLFGLGVSPSRATAALPRAPGALAFAFLLTFSPGWLYFARFVRQRHLSRAGKHGSGVRGLPLR